MFAILIYTLLGTATTLVAFNVLSTASRVRYLGYPPATFRSRARPASAVEWRVKLLTNCDECGYAHGTGTSECRAFHKDMGRPLAPAQLPRMRVVNR